MTLDNEEQRALLLQLLDMSTFPGAARQKVYALGVAVETADVTGIKESCNSESTETNP